MINKKSIGLAFACIGTLFVAPTLAEDLILFEEDGGTNGPRGLYDVDSVTGNITLRTTVGGSDRIFSLTIDPSSGDVYGIDPLSDKLMTIDVDTGVITTLGFVSGILDVIADVTFDSGGTMWGLDRNPPQTLYKIDLGSLTAIPQGNTNVARAGLTWLGDTLYAFSLDGGLYEVDPNTGNDTFIGGGGVVNLVEDATAGADGMLYFSGWTGEVYMVDPSNGSPTFINNTGNGGGCLGIIGERPGPFDCLTLTVSTLVGGESAQWDVDGATVGATVAIVYGFRPGETTVNGFGGYCATFGISGVKPTKVIGTAKADGNGHVTVLKSKVPPSASGLRILSQAAERDTCPDECVSNIDDQVVG